MFGLTVQPPPPVDDYYDPALPISFGHYSVSVLHTPGHTPGGVSLLVGRDGQPRRCSSATPSSRARSAAPISRAATTTR
jgi:glyoxylase-like metal-dependent hydrolase (beta-lactamase superfamily II)